MDKKLIAQYGEDILSYRLRTARQKKRMQYEDFDKQLLRLDREEDELYDQQKALGWEPLIPPVQKGWKRFFVLRDDVARSREADFFAGILKKINTYDWSYRKDFMIRTGRYGRNKYRVKTQRLLEPSVDHFQKLEFTEQEKKYFSPVWYYPDWSNQLHLKYVFVDPWRFVLKVKPNLVDKARKVDGAIESRIQEIDNYLKKNHYRNRLLRVWHGSADTRWWWKCEERFPYEYKNKSLAQILDSIND